MLIQLDLSVPEGERFLEREYDPELDDVSSILMDVCHFIEKKGRFIVSGFGQDLWPVDVGTDLPIFLEQLPSLLNAVNSNEHASIDFYEQGVERIIKFAPVDSGYSASCMSYTAWQPNPVTEYVEREDLRQMLEVAKKNFLEIVSVVAPNLNANQMLKDWATPG